MSDAQKVIVKKRWAIFSDPIVFTGMLLPGQKVKGVQMDILDIPEYHETYSARTWHSVDIVRDATTYENSVYGTRVLELYHTEQDEKPFRVVYPVRASIEMWKKDPLLMATMTLTLLQTHPDWFEDQMPGGVK